MTLWHGRFGADTADAVMAYSASLDFDRALAADDLAGSRAHVRGLRQAGLVTEEEERNLLDALDQVAKELEDGTFQFGPGDEDIHTAVETAGDRAGR